MTLPTTNGEPNMGHDYDQNCDMGRSATSAPGAPVPAKLLRGQTMREPGLEPGRLSAADPKSHSPPEGGTGGDDDDSTGAHQPVADPTESTTESTTRRTARPRLAQPVGAFTAAVIAEPVAPASHPLCGWCALPVRDGGVETYRGGDLLRVDHWHCSLLRVEAFEKAERAEAVQRQAGARQAVMP